VSGYAKTMFRALNQQIRLLVSPFEALDAPLAPHRDRQAVPFVCECRDEHCFAPVAIGMAEFDAICDSDEHRLIAPGHQVEGEQVVVETPSYAVVRLAEVGEDGWLAWAAGAASR
jgi:hypothetical protein